MNKPAKLTLGPVLFNWQPGKWRDFYFRIADEAAIDTVCVGEVVCSKRTPLFEDVLPEVIERLASAGKEVILSSLALIMSEAELEDATLLASCGRFMIEANDISVASMLAGQDFAVGPLINVYNESTLAILERLGATRVCLPAEIPVERLSPLAAAAQADLEVQVFGRLPLAISARCYTARVRNLAKDGCRFVCGEYPDGMEVETIDEMPFLSVNGTQTMSGSYVNLLAELRQLQTLGISRFRLSPQQVDMAGVARIYRKMADGGLDVEEAADSLKKLCPNTEFANGYFHSKQGHALVESD